MRKLALVTALFCLWAGACESSEDGRGGGLPADPSAAPEGGWMAARLDECAWSDVCDEGTLTPCLGRMGQSDDYRSLRAMMAPSWELWVARAQCIAAATSCREYRACEVPPGADCAEDDASSCDGDVAVWCRSFAPDDDEATPVLLREQRSDCAGIPGGGRCEISDTGLARCVPPAGDSGEARCVDGVAVAWEPHESDEGQGYFLWLLDCRAVGKDCDDQAACVDRGAPPCTFEGERCGGATIEECRAGRFVSWPCAEIHPDFVCVPRPDEEERAECGLPAGERQCTEGRCEGSVAVVCAQGLEVRVDCGAYAGAACVEEDDVDWGRAPTCRLAP